MPAAEKLEDTYKEEDTESLDSYEEMNEGVNLSDWDAHGLSMRPPDLPDVPPPLPPLRKTLASNVSIDSRPMVSMQCSIIVIVDL